MKPGERYGNTYGFTLLEILIAITILALILTMVYGSFIQTKKVIAITEDAVRGLRGVRVAFSRMMMDLNMAFLSDKNGNTFFVGTDNYAEEYPDDAIDFTTFSHKIRHEEAHESDQTEVGYYIKRDFEGHALLMKREKKRIDSNPLYGGINLEISDHIVGLNFRYLDKDVWVDSWDSRVSNRLPDAVEITLIVIDSAKKERQYTTIVNIPLARHR